MNYGRRTTKTTTHRDTPLSATPEPRNTMFLDLPEVTVRANAKPLSLKPVSPAQSGKDLQRVNQMNKSNYPKGLYEAGMESEQKQAKKKNRKENLNRLGAFGSILGVGVITSLSQRKIAKEQQMFGNEK